MRPVASLAIWCCVGACPAFGQKAAVCQGEERWSVKTLADSDAAKTNNTPVEKTVADMVALARPDEVNASLPRTTGTETTTYKISGTLTLYKEEADRDYHLVLEDDLDNTMIVEIP